jgi:hypothetical protein
VAPPRAGVRTRRTTVRGLTVHTAPPALVTTRDLRLAAGGAALLLAATGRGDLLFLAGLLAIALPPATRAVPLLALAGVGLRWGTTSLPAIVGAQTVLGAAGNVGPAAGAAACWCAAAALVAAAPRRAPALAAAVAAAFIVAGPSDVAVRLGAAVVAVAVTVAVTWLLPARARAGVALSLALAAFVCGAVAA